MTDIATIFSEELLTGDLDLNNQDLASEGGLKTAVILSLFTDARAGADDDLPPGSSARGYCLESLVSGVISGDVSEDRWGSKLWLLFREKMVPSLFPRAKSYALDALEWLIEDGICTAIDVTAFEVLPRLPARGGVLGLDIILHRPGKPALSFSFDTLWEATAHAV